MTHLSPPDLDNDTPDDRDPIRAILRSAPTVAVPRDFTLDPAVYGRRSVRRAVRPAIPAAVWRGLAAAAAIAVVVGATLITQPSRQVSVPVESASGRVPPALAATSIIANAVAALPTNTVIVITPLPTLIPNSAIAISPMQSAAQAAPFNAAVPQSAQLAPQSSSNASAGALAGALAPAQSPLVTSALQATPSMKLAVPNSADAANTDNTNTRAQLVIFLQALITWLRSLLTR